MIILLDGPKGAGKTSVSKILLERLDDVRFLSLDDERRALPDRSKSRTEQNKEAFRNLASKARQFVEDGHGIVVDCGLLKERIDFFEQLSRDAKVPLHKFFLRAPRETLLGRVRARDAARGNETDEARFDEVLKIVQDKDLSDFEVIDTDALSPHEIADRIMGGVA